MNLGVRTLMVGCAAMSIVVFTGCRTGLGGSDAGGTGTGGGVGEIPRELHSVMVERRGSGGGTVTSKPAGITCGTACAFNFPRGTAVTLTARPDPNSSFGGWRGAGCSGTGVCRLVVGKPVLVTATFVKNVKPVRR